MNKKALVSVVRYLCGLSFVLMFFGNAQIAQAQWTTGTNINNTNSGNVGVGTTSPTYKLEVVTPPGTTALGISFNNGTEQALQITNLAGGETWSIGPGIGGAAGMFGVYDVN